MTKEEQEILDKSVDDIMEAIKLSDMDYDVILSVLRKANSRLSKEVTDEKSRVA